MTGESLDTKHKLRPFKEAAPTNDESVQFVHLNGVDLSQYKEGREGLEARKALAKTLEEAVRTYGFFYIINHGISHETLERLKSIGQAILEEPEEIKNKYQSGARIADEETKDSLGAERGDGYKPKKYWAMQEGVRDNIELFNFRDLLHDEYVGSEEKKLPEVARDYLPEVASYFRHIHLDVLRKLCTLCDIILEIPEGSLWQEFKLVQGDRDNSGGGFGRFMLYHGMTEEEEAKTDNTWLRGHSDATAFTFIVSQPMATLQIRDYYTGEWKYVPYVEDALSVNIGDAFEFMTGGYFKSTIHRVVKPPADQRDKKRLAIIYFCDPSLNTIIDPEDFKSPKLTRLGYDKPEEWHKIKYLKWNEEKGKLFGDSKVNDSKGDKPNNVWLYGRLAERWHQAGKTLPKAPNSTEKIIREVKAN